MKELLKQLIENNPSEATVRLVYKCLYNEIILLHMLPGSKINLSKISNELNVSGTTVRDAAIMLLKDDLVNMRSNQGFFVNKLNIKEFTDIITAKKIIEPNAAKILCENITSVQINAFKNLLLFMETALKKNDYREYINLDIIFHKSIVDLCGNEYINAMYTSIFDIIKRYKLYLSKYLNKDNSDLKISLRQHTNIVKCFENTNIENAYSLSKIHIENCEKLFQITDL